jgi:hypothetical protein
VKKDNLEILLEDIRGKFDLVLEGHDALHKEIRNTRQELCEQIKLVTFKVEAINQKIENVHDKLDRKIDSVRDELGNKIDNVAADLAVHRRDTYRVENKNYVWNNGVNLIMDKLDEFKDIIDIIQKTPDVAPPADFTSNVMLSIDAEKGFAVGKWDFLPGDGLFHWTRCALCRAKPAVRNILRIPS